MLQLCTAYVALILLACVTSLLSLPLLGAQQLFFRDVVYSGCVYRAVAGMEQSLWFCLANNQCAMFHCQDNNVFSFDDCGCVPPRKPTTPPYDSFGITSNNSTTATSPMMAVIASASGVKTSAQQGGTYCPREIHVKGISGQGHVISDDSASIGLVNISGVFASGNGSASFDGYSSLYVPGYNNAEFSEGVTIDMVVEEELSPNRQVLVTNCKHGYGASLEIIMDVDLGLILFHVGYKFRVAANAVESYLHVAVPYTRHVTKRIIMVFDGRTLKGRVNESQRFALVQGNGDYVLAKRSKPLIFGNTWCDVDDVSGYVGLIREISVYKCARNITELLA